MTNEEMKRSLRRSGAEAPLLLFKNSPDEIEGKGDTGGWGLTNFHQAKNSELDTRYG
jgi:hypothetical protein